MECNELVQYLSDYIDQNLEDDLIQAAKDHLSSCHNCRVVLDTTQRTIFLYREQGKRTIPADRRQRLFDQLQETFLKSDQDQGN